jgi:sulfide dehydrogenase cytochrome subunit
MHSRTQFGLLFAIPTLLVAVAGGAVASTVAPSVVSGCNGCHGDGGVSASKDIPSIAGMSDFYLEGQMLAYQKGQRQCPNTPGDMCDLSKALTGAQIKEIGTYYAAQTWVPAPQNGLNPVQRAKGRRLHSTTCENCHTKGGLVASDDSSILAGQWLPYLMLTLQNYQAGKRLMPDKMKAKIDALSADDVDALAQFYAGEGTPSK